MYHRSPVDKLLLVTTYTRENLPRINVACREGTLTLTDWLRCLRPIVDNTDSAALNLPAEERLVLLQHLGLILASAERHAQARGYSPGWVVRQLPCLETALTIAAARIRVPVLTSELYWERNASHPPLSFTGEQHEFSFISTVRTQVALRTAVNAQLRALRDGDWDPATPEGARMIRAAAAAMKRANGVYQFDEMRPWLAPTVIRGRTFAGANAAYIPEMMVTDFLLGTASTEYDEYVRSFDQYQPPEGRMLIARDRQRPSLAKVLAAALGFGSEEIERVRPAQIVERARSAHTALSWSLAAFKMLIDEFIGSSESHGEATVRSG